MAHARSRCGVCRVVEPLGLVHIPTGTRCPAGPIWGAACKPLADRVWHHVAGPWLSTTEDPIGEDDCWPWTGATGSFDYGRISIGRREEGLIGPHRAVLLLMDEINHPPGAAPDRSGLVACHDCPKGDNPLCCNPRHLRWGTHADNAADMWAKGRARGAVALRATVNGRAYLAYLEEEAVRRELEQEMAA